MKLLFSKNEENEISVKLQKGTVIEEFRYTEMVRQLLDLNKFEDTDFGNLSENEKKRVQVMLDRISAVLEDDELLL